MDIPESVVEFYEAAKNLWKKADSIKVCDENSVEELLKALIVLHLKALYLPNFELRNSEDLSDSEVARKNSVFKIKILHRRRISCVPKIEFKSKNYYNVFFDSYDAGSTVTVSLSDDMDILMDVGTGICLYEYGYQAEAFFGRGVCMVRFNGFEWARLAKNTSGLPFDIFIDSLGCSRNSNSLPQVRVEVDSKRRIPVSIDKISPKILSDKVSHKERE